MDVTTKAAIEHLQAVGFNESEAVAYATLVRGGPMTGYQLAKASGIARPNVYAVIDRLEKRGALTRVAAGDALKYAALAPAQMLGRLSSNLGAHLSAAEEALGHLGDEAGRDYVWNIEGYDELLSRAESLIAGTREHLLIGLWSNESARLGQAVTDAQARGVSVATLCVQGCATECGWCRGEVYRYPVSGSASSRWLMLVGDDRETLMGEVAASGNTRGAQTGLPMIVAVAAQYLRNTIAASEIVRSLGPALPKVLDRAASRAVQGEGLSTGKQSWLKQALAAVARARR